MANPKNLNAPIRSAKEAREKGRKGGIKSGEVRRAKRDAMQSMRMMLDSLASLEKRKQISGFFSEFQNDNDVAIRDVLNAKLISLATAKDATGRDILNVYQVAGELSNSLNIDHTSSDGSMSPNITPEQRAERFGAMLKQLRERDGADA